MDKEKLSKVAFNYVCEKCDYGCYNKTNFAKHLGTRKHKNDNGKLSKVVSMFDCNNCGNSYKHQSGLCKHVKSCKPKPKPETQPQPQQSNPEITTLTNLMMEFIKSSTDIQKQVIELCKTGITNNNNNTINTNNTVNNNQKFNINVFLNEQCKDAMNLSDFINNIEVSREDLENNAQLGFVGGISKIFLDNLRQLSINERPIHCTDLKRETMYIKDDDKWTKETGPAKLNTVIQRISQKSTRTLLDWKKVNVDYNDNDSEFSNRCIVIQRNSMAGHDRETYYPKVIRAIAKEVILDK